MGESTGISWADHTWSPWTGCARISPACDGCYAANLMDTRMGRVHWGEPGSGQGTRSLMSNAYWRKPLAWSRKAQAAGKLTWVFPSLCDPFDNAVALQWRWRFVELMEATPGILWLLLTKRIGNVDKLTDPLRGERPLPPNHALGGTFANQDEWNRDWGKLRDAAVATGARMTFASFEPLLGPVETRGCWLPDWIITGGETDQGAHKARPSDPQWFRDLRDQAARAGKAYHHKQNGEWAPGELVTAKRGVVPAAWESGDGWIDGEVSLAQTDGHIDDEPTVYRIGKKAAGRMLDGIVHDARPWVSA